MDIDITITQQEFPPQARGWTLTEAVLLEANLVSPAGAGMDPDMKTFSLAETRFPRRRGDGP